MVFLRSLSPSLGFSFTDGENSTVDAECNINTVKSSNITVFTLTVVLVFQVEQSISLLIPYYLAPFEADDCVSTHS